MLFAQGLPPPSLDLLVEIKLMPHGGQDALFAQDSDDGDDDVGKRIKYRRKGDVAILLLIHFFCALSLFLRDRFAGKLVA